MYYCRIYPQTWSQFCIPGQWEGVSSGGAPPKKEDKEIQQHSNEKSNFNKKTTNLAANLGSAVGGFGANPSSLGASQDMFKKGVKASNLQLNLQPIAEEGGLTNIGRSSVILNKPSTVVDHNKINERGSIIMNAGRKPGIGQQEQQSHSPSNVPKQEKNKEAAVIKPKDNIRRLILKDSEDRWFLNPQYKIEIKPGTKLIITLLQEDELLVKKPYHKCNFVIILSVSFTFMTLLNSFIGKILTNMGL